MVSRCGLVVPSHPSAVTVQGDDGGRVQAVAVRGPQLSEVVGRRICRTEIDQVERGIIGESIPGRAAALELRGAMPIPRLVRSPELRILIRSAHGGRYGVETPPQLAP